MPVSLIVFSRRPACVVSMAVFICVVLLTSVHANGQEADIPTPMRRLGRDVPVYVPLPGDPERREAPPIPRPTGPVTLPDAEALALLHNPGLAAFAWETRAREVRILQAGRPPNPTLSLLAEDIGASRRIGHTADPLVEPQATIQISQVIELGGKRAARRHLATRDRDLAVWDYESARVDVLTAVNRAFIDVLADQEAVALSEETTHLVEQVHQSVGARVAAGVVSPIEETRASVALAAVRVESMRARRALEASRTRLSLLWGSATPVFRAAIGNLDAEPAPLPPLGDLMARIEQGPELARWVAELSQREAAVELERSRRIPDVSLVAGYRRLTGVGSHAFVVGASMPLPWFDRNRDGVEEARSRLARAHEERRAVQTRVAATLADAYAALASAHDEVNVLRSAVLPGSQETFEALSEGYRLGRFGYVDVLEAQRTLIGARNQYLRALAAYHTAVADVERLTATPLAGSTNLQTTARK